MKYKTNIFLIVLAVFLFTISTVSASEIVSEDANQVDLYSNDIIIEDNHQILEKESQNTQTIENDNPYVENDSTTYSNLDAEINQPGNIKLTHKKYIYNNNTPTIKINENNKVIDGNGAIIDMNGSDIPVFNITTSSSVTIKNITIKNTNHTSNGSTIRSDSANTMIFLPSEALNNTETWIKYSAGFLPTPIPIPIDPSSLLLYPMIIHSLPDDTKTQKTT